MNSSDPDRHVIYMLPQARMSQPPPKRHLDRFSRFRRAHERDQQTDRHTHTHAQTAHATLGVAVGRYR